VLAVHASTVFSTFFSCTAGFGSSVLFLFFFTTMIVVLKIFSKTPAQQPQQPQQREGEKQKLVINVTKPNGATKKILSTTIMVVKKNKNKTEEPKPAVQEKKVEKTVEACTASTASSSVQQMSCSSVQTSRVQ
jgi:hypothetical protein